jgi:hypothetical protein
MQPDSHTQYSFWLVPAEPLNRQLSAIIRQLAGQFDAVYFEPHVTIYSGILNDAEAAALATRVAGQFTPLELTALRLDHTDSYTKTLFMRLGDAGTARRMFEAIKQASAQPSDYVLDPHLSLLYKQLAPSTQAELCQTLAVPRGNYLFDRLRVIETEIPLSLPEQIRRWRTVYDGALAAT